MNTFLALDLVKRTATTRRDKKTDTVIQIERRCYQPSEVRLIDIKRAIRHDRSDPKDLCFVCNAPLLDIIYWYKSAGETRKEAKEKLVQWAIDNCKRCGVKVIE